MFNVLIKRKMCPAVVRFLLNMCIRQTLRVKWNKNCSHEFNVVNGVKQGGVLSPMLFTMYIDDLLTDLQKSKVGCHIGSEYMGSFGCADDIVLLSPSIPGLKAQLDICSQFAVKSHVKFNPSKTKLILCKKPGSSTSDHVEPIVHFQNRIIEFVTQD